MYWLGACESAEGHTEEALRCVGPHCRRRAGGRGDRRSFAGSLAAESGHYRLPNRAWSVRATRGRDRTRARSLLSRLHSMIGRADLYRREQLRRDAERELTPQTRCDCSGG